MKDMNAYLNFDGNCREAMTFYAKCLDGELQMMKVSEAPVTAPQEAKDRIVHARVTKGRAVLMASDTMPGMPFHQGNSFSICVDCESMEEIRQLFGALGESGTVRMKLQDAFWGAHFGMLTDRFGVNWMLNFEKPKQQ